MQRFTQKITGAVKAHQSMAGQFVRPLELPSAPSCHGRLPLVIYSQVAWDTVWQRPQEEAMGFSRYRPVIFVGPVQLHEVAGRLKDRWEYCRKLEGGRLTVLSPLLFSGEYRNETIRFWNRRIIKHVFRQIASLGKTILMTNTPFVEPMVDALDPAHLLMDYIDDFCGFSWSPKEGRELEQKLLSRLDLGFAGTGFLLDQYEDRVPGMKFLPSGVKFDALTDPTEEPADIRDLPHPRTLYVGTLNDRLDGKLFLDAAEANPKGSVVVVGPKHETFRTPKLPGNVHFLGLKPHTELPGYYQHCDLGIMPFGDSDAAKAINPIKTLEYLAVGMPVLSTPVPDVVKYYDGVVDVAAAKDWPAALRRLLQPQSDEDRERRVDFARNRSWKSMVVAMEKSIRRLEGSQS